MPSCPLPLTCLLPLPRTLSGEALMPGDGLLSWLLPVPLPWPLPLFLRQPLEVLTGEELQDLIEGATGEEVQGGGE